MIAGNIVKWNYSVRAPVFPLNHIVELMQIEWCKGRPSLKTIHMRNTWDFGTPRGFETSHLSKKLIFS